MPRALTLLSDHLDRAPHLQFRIPDTSPFIRAGMVASSRFWTQEIEACVSPVLRCIRCCEDPSPGLSSHVRQQRVSIVAWYGVRGFDVATDLESVPSVTAREQLVVTMSRLACMRPLPDTQSTV
jgi:hypothetical protein